MKLEISGELLQRCQWASDQRQANRQRAGSRDFAAGHPSDATNLLGVISEVALLRYFGLAIGWSFLATDAGFCAPDVGDLWEVRATVNPRGRLYLFEREVTPEKLAAPFAWVLLTDPKADPVTCDLRGWALGCEVVSGGILQQIQRAPSYFLANDQLRPFGTPEATWRAARWCANSARTALALHQQAYRAAA